MCRAIAAAVWKVSGLAALSLAAGCGGTSAGSDAGGGGAASSPTGGMGGSAGASSDNSAGGSSGGSANPNNTAPKCDTASDNVSVSGFGTPVTGANNTVVATVNGSGNTTAGGLAYQASTDTPGATVTVQIASNSQSIREGANLEIGKDGTLTVQGSTGPAASQQFFCEATGGNIKINSLATHNTDPNNALLGETLDKANVSFTATCKQATVKPTGVTQVTGCYNYIAQ